ncbi:MAG: Mth938-like domain-containing protein, partial [Rhodospirillales bacterium]|nr:Mth938-like domain-containing protein [Rhodospirillales bacterium]
MPGLDITPHVAPGRQLIQSYGNMRFRIAGNAHRGSVIVLPERILPWSVREAAAITVESLAPLTEAEAVAGILVVGCGPRFQPVPMGLREDLKQAGLVLEWMDTGAACRT